MSSISILLADDHQIVRAGLRNLFEAEKDMKVVGEAENGRLAVQMARELAPSVVVMDITMPDLNGVEATRQIVAESPTSRVVALSAHTDRHFVTEALRAGAAGYLPKTSAFDELVGAVRTVAAGKVYLSPGVANVVIESYVRGDSSEGRSAFALLSTREREVLQLMAEGQATKEVARTLHVSVKTVETHRAKIMDKLNLHSVAELTKYAIREGLTSVEA
ncbi:MAG: response regulator transcription factor [Tepidisphaeraceae bacterium]|jgi:DNA-binding NarL/FixJ family response regulator